MLLSPKARHYVPPFYSKNKTNETENTEVSWFTQCLRGGEGQGKDSSLPACRPHLELVPGSQGRAGVSLGEEEEGSQACQVPGPAQTLLRPALPDLPIEGKPGQDPMRAGGPGVLLVSVSEEQGPKQTREGRRILEAFPTDSKLTPCCLGATHVGMGRLPVRGLPGSPTVSAGRLPKPSEAQQGTHWPAQTPQLGAPQGPVPVRLSPGRLGWAKG